MSFFSVGHRLPGVLRRPLFGDRERWGRVVQPDDPCWREWERTYSSFYFGTQKQSVGKRVNDAGYRVMRHVELQGATVLEIGPGEINHAPFWRGVPARYHIADVLPEMLDRSAERLRGLGVPVESTLLSRDGVWRLPFADASLDRVISFYAFEHLYPFAPHLDEIRRVLKPGGLLVGGIPTEGGVAWGTGRLLTSRRWLRRNTSIDPDKLICWEHPNFAEEVLRTMDAAMERRRLDFWPLRVPAIDLNLIVSFVYARR